MRAQKLENGNIQVVFEPSEIHIVQFLAKFFLSIPRQVFTGRFVRRVRRMHDALEEVH
jgi:hypothetical protein